MKTKQRLVTALFLTTALTLPGCGHAAGVVVETTFAERDRDGDGRLSPGEAGLASAAFAALDANGDGYLDVLEWGGSADNGRAIAQAQAAIDARRTAADRGQPGTTLR